MVVVQGSKVTLPNPCSLSSPPHTTSILFEPTSLSLALTHSDSSISLFPSFSPLSSPSPSLPPSQTLIPFPSSSSTFLLLQNPNSTTTTTVIFLVSSPYRAGSQILLRFYILRKTTNSFVRVPRVLCSQNDLRFEPNLGVLLNSKHGVSIKLAGSVNYFALYSVSSSKVWVFAAKIHDDDCAVKLMRCAVIECSRPVWSVSVSFGFLLLGEENGVRVFGLRRLVKGRVKKRVGNLNSGLKQLRNGGGKRGGSGEGVSKVVNCNGDLEGRIEKLGVYVKQTNVKLKHKDGDGAGGSCFVGLKRNEDETKSTMKVSMSIKAISIQAVSQRMFLILDSHGDLHLLCLSNSGIGVDITGTVRQLPHIMKVKSLAVFPDVSNKLPLRLADFGVLHRNEATGALSGLTRVRRFQQDDAHIFCRESQIKDEVRNGLNFINYVYNIFGFTYELKLSTRPEKYLGDLATWEKAESALKEALDDFGKPWQLNEGDGAFYGPKIDISVSDALSRKFQCATLQLDFQLPDRFKLEYSAEDEAKIERPVMIHRAILGSVERMFAILLEHYKGKWPFWLSPRQAIVCPVSEKSQSYALQVRDQIHQAGYHVDADTTDRKIQKKVREAQLAQYNYILVVGEEEANTGQVSVRVRDKADHSVTSIENLLKHFRDEIVAFH